MLAFEAMADRLGLGATHPAMRAAWAGSQAAAGEGLAGFLRTDALVESARTLDLPADFILQIAPAVEAARADPVLLAYLWHCRRLLSDMSAGWPVMGAGFPPIRPDASPAAGMGYGLVVLDLIPEAFGLYRARGVPEPMILDILKDVRIWVEEYRRVKGVWGLSNLGWMQNHLRARIFRVGRLQFRLEHYGLNFHGWRDRRTGRVRVLAGEGLWFDASGYKAGTGASHDPDMCASAYAENETDVTGMPVDPAGRVLREPVRLAKEQWERVLGPGDPVIGIHIPAGAPMDFEACGESFGRAPAFFAAHAPEHPVKAFTCSSWLLDPQFEGRLPAASNIVRFLREMYLHPLPGATDGGLFERVFGGKRPTPDTPLAGMTTLQRAVTGHVRAGGTWRGGASLLFPQDLNWGGAVYRAMWLLNGNP